MRFQPHEYGDPWAKLTYLWGHFSTALPRTPVPPSQHRRTTAMGSDVLRSQTPAGFARAFFEANP